MEMFLLMEIILCISIFNRIDEIIFMQYVMQKADNLQTKIGYVNWQSSGESSDGIAIRLRFCCMDTTSVVLIYAP